MALVDYSDSDPEESNDPPAKRPRLSDSAEVQPGKSVLPPLPTAFRDLYSSTVRASTQDDPSLHAGRKRVTPHVAGHWPTHVFLEWYPSSQEHSLLNDVIEDVRQSYKHSSPSQIEVHSLLENDLGVRLPLHVSLSRPLTLKTEQKDGFHSQLEHSIAASGTQAFIATPLQLAWHANEDKTRWFLVMRLQRPPQDGLRKLLRCCNDSAGKFRQPLLYPDQRKHRKSHKPSEADDPHDNFHISIAWSLHLSGAKKDELSVGLQSALPATLQSRLRGLTVNFATVKVRIGQDVTSIPLQKSRAKQNVE